MNQFRIAGILVGILGATIALGFFGPLNPSCGSGLISFLTSGPGLCQSYAPYVGLGAIIGGIILIGVSKDED